jgi:hypothetical protein
MECVWQQGSYEKGKKEPNLLNSSVDLWSRLMESSLGPRGDGKGLMKVSVAAALGRGGQIPSA